MYRFINLTILLSTLFLMACSSMNVKKFNPDPLHKANIEKSIKKKVAVKVIMHKNDVNSIMCRMAGNIYLPNKMTYSQYIADAFKKTLVSANRLSDDNNNVLLVELTKVDYSSTSGKWYIDAITKTGKSTTVEIKSVTEFGTSWDAGSACNNVANAFEEAVGNFVNEVLSNTTIINNL